MSFIHCLSCHSPIFARMKGTVNALRQWLQPFQARVREDDIMLLAPVIAFNLLMSLVPLLVLIVVIAGFFLNSFDPQVREPLISTISSHATKGEFFKLALSRLTSTSSWLVALVVVIPSVWFGSEFFVALDRCFSRIFRSPPRPFLHQRLMALRMVGVFILVIPFFVIVSAFPSQIKQSSAEALTGRSALSHVLFFLLSFIAEWLVVAVLFLVIYVLVPHGHVRHVWKGTLIAATLLAGYTMLFPFLAGGDLNPPNDATNAGFALAALAYFYFFGVCLLLGAEINAVWGRPRQEPIESDNALG